MSQERWLTIVDGKLCLHTENDGWTFKNRGLEQVDTPVSLVDYMLRHSTTDERTLKEGIALLALPENREVLVKELLHIKAVLSDFWTACMGAKQHAAAVMKCCTLDKVAGI
jgi:hypothetical protein